MSSINYESGKGEPSPSSSQVKVMSLGFQLGLGKPMVSDSVHQPPSENPPEEMTTEVEIIILRIAYLIISFILAPIPNPFPFCRNKIIIK